MCKALKRYEMEDFALIDKFFSKESVRDLIFLHWSSQVLILLIVTCENPIVSFVLQDGRYLKNSTSHWQDKQKEHWKKTLKTLSSQSLISKKIDFDNIISSKEIERKRILVLKLKEDRFVPALEEAITTSKISLIILLGLSVQFWH